MGQPNASNSNVPQSPLHPLLQSALGCLEVQLDDELTRYRRQRSAQPTPNRPFKGNIRTKKKHGLDLISVKPSSPNPAATHPPTQPAAAPYPTGSSYTNGSANGAHHGHSDNGNGNGIQAIAGAGGAIATLNVPQSQESRDAIATAPHTAQAHGNIVPVPHSESNHLGATHDAAEPQDYLKSSEHLLQSLVEEAQTAENPKKSGWTNQLFTPLGIGSMLLLLVSSVGLGYVIANPDAISSITTRWQADDETSSTDLDAPITPSASEFDPSGQPNLSSEEFVELDLGTLSTLPSNGSAPNLPSPAPGLAADGSTTPTPLASPVTPSNSATATGTTRTPSSSASPTPTTPSASSSAAPSSSSSSRSSAPASSSASGSRSSQSASASRPAAPAPAAPPAPRPAASPSTERAAASSGSSGSGAGSNSPASGSSENSGSSDRSETTASSTGSASSSDYYHVVVPYTGDQSLNEARQVAGDAYIHNSSAGATIRLGAFADQSSAQEMVQNLQEQGIDADIEE
ncbi:MAG: hypothetical protein ACTS2F_02265 [Thainema sp.]